MAGLVMAERKRTCYFDSVTNSEEKKKSAAHTSSYITWEFMCYLQNTHSPFTILCPPPPHSPCPLTVKRVGQHEHTTPTVVVCCVHCTPLHTHQEYHSVCTHSPPPPPPGCRAVPRSKDQVLFLKPLHLGVGWLDPHAGCHWLGGCWAPWPVITTTFTMQA